MTGDTPPPTQRTPEELIARLIAAFLAYVSALIDATMLPRACRKRLHARFAALFARYEAKLIAIIHEQRAENAVNQPEPTTAKPAQPTKPPAPAPTRRNRTKTTPIPTTAPAPTSAPTAESPIAEAPHQKRAPAPHHPACAPVAVGPSTLFTRPNPKIFQKTAFNTPLSHAHVVTISQ